MRRIDGAFRFPHSFHSDCRWGSRLNCDICGAIARHGDGYVLTSSEVSASPHYWENQLPKFASVVAAIDDIQEKANFLVERIAQYALDPTGWLVCELCSTPFQNPSVALLTTRCVGRHHRTPSDMRIRWPPRPLGLGTPQSRGALA